MLANDTLAKTDANVWTKAELILSDAFMQVSKHLKQGRLLPDSISLSADTTLTNDFFIKNLNTVVEKKMLLPLLNSLEPQHTGYSELKKGIKRFPVKCRIQKNFPHRRAISRLIGPNNKGLRLRNHEFDGWYTFFKKVIKDCALSNLSGDCQLIKRMYLTNNNDVHFIDKSRTRIEYFTEKKEKIIDSKELFGRKLANNLQNSLTF